MPLPLKTLRVFPNPWTFIHHELGPQGSCVVDLSGRDGEDAPLRWVGATRSPVMLEEREPMKIGKVAAADPRGNRVFARFSYPGLKADLLSGDAVDLPNTPYYRQQLERGDLVPADERTAKASRSAFADLKEAKDAGVAKFDADFGPGSFEELAALLADERAEKKSTKPAAAKQPAPTPALAVVDEKPKPAEGSKV